MNARSTNNSNVVATDPLGNVKRAIVAIGKLPQEPSPLGTSPYLDDSVLRFDVESTGFLYVHTPFEFVNEQYKPDPETGATYYPATVWIVTCKHCIPDSGEVAVRLNTKSGITRVFPIHCQQWTKHATEDIAITPLSLGAGRLSDQQLFDVTTELEFNTIGTSHSALCERITKLGFYESTAVSMIGFPVGMIEGGMKNYPVVRSGSIAQIEGYLDGDPKHTRFLIDGSVFGGNSGGPVVVRKGTFNAGSWALSETILIGMVSESAYTRTIYEDASSSDIMQNADLVYAVTIDAIHATIRAYYLAKQKK